MKLSIIIPARNEFPNIVHTLHAILNCLEDDGFTPQDFEIIIVDNCSDDDKFPQRGTGGTSSYLFGRGAYYNRIIRHLYDPIAGNHSARNKGAEIARGEYIFFSDAHMSYCPRFFSYMIQACEESGGLVHGCLQYMGAYPPVDRSGGFQYTIKLGEEIKGTWNTRKVADTWFYIPAQGHWGVMANRKDFLSKKGYPGMIDSIAHLSAYGGGEFFLDMKWWMLGSTVVTEPRAIGYHLAAGRGYSYNHDHYIMNTMAIGFMLGMDKWVERFCVNTLRRGRPEVVEKLYRDAWMMAQPDRKFINKYKKRTMDDILVSRPWDTLNDKRHKTHSSGLSVFHDTWEDGLYHGNAKLGLPAAPTWLQELYRELPRQRELEGFIKEKMLEFEYKASV